MDTAAASPDCNVTLCNKCKLCKNGGLNTDGTFVSNITNKKYTIKSNMTCKSKMFIYVITCKHPGCKIKYTGKSTCIVQKRMYGHRNNLTAGNEPHLLQHHFTKVHKPSDMCILPIEIVQNSKELAARENFWIRELNTVFPYGLNDRTDVNGIHDAYEHIIMNRSEVTIYSTFNQVKIERSNEGRQRAKKQRSQEVPLDCLKLLKELLELDTDNPLHHIRNKIMSLTKLQTKDLYIYTIKNIENPKFVAKFNEYFIFLVKDICLFKLQRYYKQKKSNNLNFLVVNFANKLVENVNLQKIFNNADVYSSFPHPNIKMSIPSISYSY